MSFHHLNVGLFPFNVDLAPSRPDQKVPIAGKINRADLRVKLTHLRNISHHLLLIQGRPLQLPCHDFPIVPSCIESLRLLVHINAGYTLLVGLHWLARGVATPNIDASAGGPSDKIGAQVVAAANRIKLTISSDLSPFLLSRLACDLPKHDIFNSAGDELLFVLPGNRSASAGVGSSRQSSTDSANHEPQTIDNHPPPLTAALSHSAKRPLENRFGCCNGQLACLGIDVPQRFGGEANERLTQTGPLILRSMGGPSKESIRNWRDRTSVRLVGRTASS